MENPVRATTLFVVKNSKDVKINREKIKELAKRWIRQRIAVPLWPAEFHCATNDVQQMLDYLIILDSINFCFWSKKERWQISYKGKKYNGYFALSLALKKFFGENPGKANLDYFSKISFKEFKKILQGGKNLLFLKKRWQIAIAVSQTIIKKYGSSENFVKSTGNKFSVLVKKASKLPGFNDIFSYNGKKIYILKRAQILACDIWGAFGGKGIGYFEDLDYLTCFADYKIPQILNYLGILEYSSKIQNKINKKISIAMGSKEEVEIRSATVQAVEILRDELAERGRSLPAFEVDWILWNKMQKQKIKNNHHLTKTIFY